MSRARDYFLRMLLAGAVLVPACSIAQSPAAGASGRPVGGTVVSLEPGDVACYLTIKDAKGRKVTEMAAFELCDRSSELTGRAVTLTYREAQVMAASCQGDPACRKTERKTIVASAHPVAAGAPRSHCNDSETVVFTCSTGTKSISVCASKNLGAKTGTVQYRFGPIGKPEMLLPDPPAHPSGMAEGHTETFAAGGGAWLRFRQGDHAYTVYTGIGKWGPRGEVAEKAGVLVERGGKRLANVSCKGKETSELGPDWFSQAGVRSTGEFFVFPD